MGFIQSDYDTLIHNPANAILNRTPDEKYADFKNVDPFPDVKDALLNSVDILKYISTVGMIDPFDITQLEGVTYTCHFSGQYYFWEGKADCPDKCDGILQDEEELVLRPNSITYLEIEEKFQIPDYIIFRYNLEVSHVYKGLLLGTGPIVDPGFVGKLYIPLHNLTSNEYIIKKGASLIELEFTKVGRNKATWPRNVKREQKQGNGSLDSVLTLDFSAINHAHREIEANRPFYKYLNRALIGDLNFKKNKDVLSVISSIPESIKTANEDSKNAKEDAERAKIAAEKAEKAAGEIAKQSEDKLNSILKWGIIGGAVTLAIATIATVLSIVGMFNDINDRINDLTIIKNQYDQIVSENSALKEKIQDLEEQLLSMINNDQVVHDETDTDTSNYSPSVESIENETITNISEVSP